MGELYDMSRGTLAPEESDQEIFVAGEKSDQELINEGRAIARDTEQKGISVMRSTGEWYAEVQATRKKAPRGKSKNAQAGHFKSAADICSSAGISASKAANSAQFIRAFPTDGDMQGLGVEKCNATLPAHTHFKKECEGNESLAQREFERFILSVAAGDCFTDDPDEDYVYTNSPVPLDQVKRQVSLLKTGKLPAKSDKIDEATSTGLAIEVLTPVIMDNAKNANAAKQIESAVKTQVKQMERNVRGHFHDEVIAAAESIAEQRTAELTERAKLMYQANQEAKKKADDKFAMAEARAKRLPMFMTKDEFRKIRGCLRSDRQPDDLKARFDEASAIFDRLAEGASWS